jgi:hypothetical protein
MSEIIAAKEICEHGLRRYGECQICEMREIAEIRADIITSLTEQVEKMRAALKPFADAAGACAPTWDDSMIYPGDFTVGALRAAKEASEK